MSLMKESVAHAISRGAKLLYVAGIISLAASILAGEAMEDSGQIQGTEAGYGGLRFDALSIRQNKSGGQQILGKTTSDGWEMRNMFLLAPILAAYVPLSGVAKVYADDQVVGAPQWLVSDDDKYDIDAKVDEGDLANWQNPSKQPAMLRAMLQEMLADRMRLKVHRGTKEARVYTLVVGAKGPRFRETDPNASHSGSYPMPGGGTLSMERKDGWVTTHYFAISIGQLVSFVLNAEGRPVQDKTGLTGKYDMTVVKPIPEGVGTPQVAPVVTSAAEIADQLGLKLVSSEGRVETLFIDHVERPSEN